MFSRRKFSQPALWAVLDAGGVPFRTTLGALIDAHGLVPSGWTDHVSYCHLPGNIAGFPELDGPLAVAVSSTDDLAAPPSRIVGYVRQYANARRNFAVAAKALRRLFGSGRDTSAFNTVAARWGGRYCQVTAMAFPVELQDLLGENRRHALVPGSETECTITIQPDFRPQPDARILTALQHHQPDTRFDVPAMGHLNWSPLPEKSGQQPGLGLTTDSLYFIAVSRDRRFLAIPVRRITSVHHDVLTPAKFSGCSTISLSYRPNDLEDAPQLRLTLMQGEYDAPGHETIARSLADRLSLPFRQSKQSDA